MSEEYTIGDEYIIKNLDTLKIIADPTRLEVMRTLKKPRTVKEVSEILETDPTKLYYHVRQLEKHDLIRVVETNIVSGIIEKTYQVVAHRFRVDDSLISATEMTDENLDALFHAIFDVVKDEIRRSIRAGLMKIKEEELPEKHGVARTAVHLTETEAATLFSELRSLMEKYDALSEANEANGVGKAHGFLFAFYPLYRHDLEEGEPSNLKVD